MPAHGTPAIDALRRAGVAFEVVEYASPEPHARDREARPSYGLDAAAAIGVDPGRMYKTLIATADTRLVAGLVSVDRELDLKRLAAAVGARKATLAEPAVAERATGYVVGGISPLGGRRSLPTVIDRSVDGHETVYVSAGRRGLQLVLRPADLVHLTTAIVAEIARS
jgi:Cys-tRNA(Pro)/Cys-tRNA(Cys) deacylase